MPDPLSHSDVPPTDPGALDGCLLDFMRCVTPLPMEVHPGLFVGLFCLGPTGLDFCQSCIPADIFFPWHFCGVDFYLNRLFFLGMGGEVLFGNELNTGPLLGGGGLCAPCDPNYVVWSLTLPHLETLIDSTRRAVEGGGRRGTALLS